MSTSRFASFAPYRPPPDDPSNVPVMAKSNARSWLPAHASSPAVATSYQSGGVPTFNTSESGGLGAVEEADIHQNEWKTRYGSRVDVLAVLAYLLGPFSALALLIFETENDFVRFHAYQSALLSTPLILLRIFAALVQFPPWLQTLCTLLLVMPMLYMAFRAYRDASQLGLPRYHLPILGQVAEIWLSLE